METVISKLRGTGQHVAKHSSTFFSRARKAGRVFIEETAAAGGDFAGFARDEVRRWQQFALRRVTTTRTAIVGVSAVPAIERQLLTQVDHALVVLESRVQARLSTLAKKPRRKARLGAKATKKAGARKPRSAPLLAA